MASDHSTFRLAWLLLPLLAVELKEGFVRAATIVVLELGLSGTDASRLTTWATTSSASAPTSSAPTSPDEVATRTGHGGRPRCVHRRRHHPGGGWRPYPPDQPAAGVVTAEVTLDASKGPAAAAAVEISVFHLDEDRTPAFRFGLRTSGQKNLYIDT